MEKKLIIVTSASSLNNYKNNILFTLKDYDGLYVGDREFYTTGVYNNHTNSLKKLTDNTKLMSLLNGTYSHIALASLIASGRFSVEDITEFYEICGRLNIKMYDDISEKDNKTLYRISNKKRREDNDKVSKNESKSKR